MTRGKFKMKEGRPCRRCTLPIMGFGPFLWYHPACKELSDKERKAASYRAWEKRQREAVRRTASQQSHKRGTTMRLLPALALFACAASAAPAVSLTARIVRTSQAADTLAMSASWQLPPDDGRGPIDSLRVVWLGIHRDSMVVFPQPLPTSASMRLTIPASAYPSGGGGSATYPVSVIVTTVRRGLFSPLSSNTVNIVLLDAAPPPVSGLTLTATRVFP